MSVINAPRAKLLIVEDIPYPDGECLKGQLLANDYEVLEIAGSTRKAIELARSLRPDLVLMDLKIPLENGGAENRLGGIRAAEEIQRMGNIGIVYITAEPPAVDILQAVKKASPDAMYVTKPYHVEQVLAAVRLTLMKKQGGKVIFLCYSRAIDVFKDECVQFLKPLEGFGIEAWHDKQIKAGEHWQQAIEQAVERADIAILLISIEFVNSRFITEFELPKLLNAAAERGVLVVPVFVGFVPERILENLGLLAFLGINDPAKPLNTWTREDREQEAWGRLCQQLLENHSGGSLG